MMLSDRKLIKLLAERRNKRLEKIRKERGEKFEHLKAKEPEEVCIKKPRMKNDPPALIKEYKETLKSDGCVICNYRNCFRALVFHHIGGYKNASFNSLRTIKEINKEIELCWIVILCANCHAETHEGLVNEKMLIEKRIRTKCLKVNNILKEP